MADRSTWVAGHGRPATHDVVIIGGGAAGLSAALVLGRARRRVAVIDAGAPRNAPAAHMQGFLSRDGMPPQELLVAGRAEVLSYGVELVDDRVVEVEPAFSVHLAGGSVLEARRILIASGAHDELPDIAGSRERWGRDFLHCPYCHGWEVRDQPIGVIGTGPGSAEHAQLLRQWSDDVIFFANGFTVTAAQRTALEARGIRIVAGAITALSVVDDRLEAVQLAGGRAIPRAAVFIRPALHPHTDGLIASLGCEIDAGGFRSRRPQRTHERRRCLGGRQRQQPARTGDHGRRRRICRRDRDQRRPRRRRDPQRGSKVHRPEHVATATAP